MRLFLFILLLLFGNLFAQEIDSNIELFPSGLNFRPLIANIEEAKFGVLYFPENGNLKVDIGNTVDLLRIHISEKQYVTFGIEFMGYAWAANYSNYRLQINALDGFFGGNIIYKNSNFYTRFRIIHNSAHLVDGRFDQEKNGWIEDYLPIPFTRDFAEVTVLNKNHYANINFRYYFSGSWSYKIRPNNLSSLRANVGVESYFINPFGKFLNNDMNIVFAYQLSSQNSDSGIINNNFIVGMKLGNYLSKGILFYLSYYNGGNYFHEYYNQRISKFAIGFNIDFI